MIKQETHLNQSPELSLYVVERRRNMKFDATVQDNSAMPLLPAGNSCVVFDRACELDIAHRIQSLVVH